MQNSQPYLRLPGIAPRKGMRTSPRRYRRGALMPAALLAVLLFTVLLSQFAQAQLRHAHTARAQARAVQLAAIAADFDTYVHENRQMLASGLAQAASRGRALTIAERAAFETDYLRVGLNRQMPGFTLTYLVGRIADGDEVFGGLLLGNSATGDAATPALEPEMEALMARLAGFGAQDRYLDRAGFVQNVLGRTLTGSERVILTAPLSALGTKYVLRMRRAGHRAPKLVGSGRVIGALDLNGNNLVNAGNITATGGDKSAATRVVGTLRTPEITGTPGALRSIAEENSAPGEYPGAQPPGGGNVDIAGTTRVAGRFTVQRRLTAGALAILTGSSAGAADSDPATIGGALTLSRHLQTGTLTTARLRADNLATQSINIRRLATASTLLAETLQTPQVSQTPQGSQPPALSNRATPADGTAGLSARQVFTERAEITNLQTGGCTGC